MATIEYSKRNVKPGSRVRDVLTQMKPLGPAILALKNRGVERQRAEEMMALGLPAMERPDAVLEEFHELCDYYERLYPDKAFYWQRAREFLTAHASGPAALLDLVKYWGFVKNKKGGLDIPDWWDGKLVLPLEFQDYSQDQYPDDVLRAADIQPQRFHALANKGAAYGWMGYYLTKGRLSIGGVSTLIKDVPDCVLQLKKQVEVPKGQPLMVYVMGISEDEVAAFSNKDLCVIAFNMGFSPIMEKLISSGRVQRVLAQRNGQGKVTGLIHADTQEPLKPQANKCYACQVNVVDDGLPVSDSSGIAVTNLTLHHNSLDGQAAIIREMNRVSLPLPGDGRAWVFAELFRNPYVISTMTNHALTSGPEAWDAWVSFVNAVVGIDHLVKTRQDWAKENIPLKFTYLPRGLDRAPSLIQQFVMPQIQVLVTGY